MIFRTRFALGIALALVASPAFADDKATAEILFNEGQKLVQAGKFAEACPKLADSQRLDPGIGTALYLGNCYEKISRFASAWGSFREAVSLAERSNDKRAAVAKRNADRLEPLLSRLTLKVAGDVPAGVRIERNGKPITAAEIGLAIPLDGGACTITADVTGRERWSSTVSIPDQGGSVQVVVHAGNPVGTTAIAKPDPKPDPTPNPALDTNPPPQTEQPKSGGMTGMRATGIAMGGLGVVAVGIGAGLALAAKSAFDGSNGPGKCDAMTNFCTPDGLGARSSARTQADIATALFIAGGALVGAAVVFVIVGAPKKTAAFAPVISPTHAGASFSLQFE